MKLVVCLTFSILLVITSNTVLAQELERLAIRHTGGFLGKYKYYYVGDVLTLRMKKDRAQISTRITQIDVDQKLVYLDGDPFKLDEIDKIYTVRTGLKRFGGSAFILAVLFGASSLASDSQEERMDRLVISGAMVATGVGCFMLVKTGRGVNEKKPLTIVER